MRLLNLVLKSTGKKGVPQGGVISPVLSNLYLSKVDRMLEKARATTRRGKYAYVMLLEDLSLGTKEDSASSDAGQIAQRPGLETVE